jgi:hypothetical protein
MTTSVCRSAVHRNASFAFALASNHSKITDAEWITNSISLLMFLLAFVGNAAALMVMFASRGPIRLTNNRYLANLAVADLLRTCFIPFTIIARMKRNFIFGKIICRILPVVQGEPCVSSVSVASVAGAVVESSVTMPCVITNRI